MHKEQALDRLLSSIEVDADGCWLWTGRVTRDGYGSVGGWWVHRLAYEEIAGPIPTGYQIDHLCKVRHCVNPDHLEPVTPRVNVIRSRGEICPLPRTELSEPDVRVMVAIRNLRAEYHACSFGQLMIKCGYQSKVGPQTRCNVLKELGLVDWSEGVHGSIHLTRWGGERLSAWLGDHPEFDLPADVAADS